MPTADESYQAKLAARADGTTEVMVYPPASVDAGSNMDARYQAKLAARAAAAKAAPAPKPAPKRSAAELLDEATKAEAEEKASHKRSR